MHATITTNYEVRKPSLTNSKETSDLSERLKGLKKHDNSAIKIKMFVEKVKKLIICSQLKVKTL